VNDIANKVTAAPKQNPGNRSGKSTPNAIPTAAESAVKMYKNTSETSDPTCTNRGSKNAKVTNPAMIADNMPE
jgi:hypothetical protein